MTPNYNQFAELSTDEPNSSREEAGITTTHLQRANATKENTQANESAAAAQNAVPSSSNVSSTLDEKPKEKGWEASLTLAQLKAYKAEAALKAHNKRFPPKPKVDPATANTKQVPAKTKTSVDTDQAHSDLKNAKGNARQETNNYKAVPVAPQVSCSGCGIIGCPVKDKHERRVYAVLDPNRPNLIKKIQAKFGAEESELKTLTRFFESHKRDAEADKHEGE